MNVPVVLTVPEAAAVLRIGRTAAYELTKLYRDSQGAEGIPVIEAGGSLRVPTARFEEWTGVKVTWEALHPASDRPCTLLHDARLQHADQTALPFAG